MISIKHFYLQALTKIFKVFKSDSRYIVEHSNGTYKLFSSATSTLLAEFTPQGNKLYEHAFRDSFNEIERQITNEYKRLETQVKN